MKLSVVIPVYNSEKSIPVLTKNLIELLSKDYELEIVLVNDASEDNTEKVCINLFESYPDIVKFYSLAKNVGEHNAVMAGLNFATGDWVVIMDDDLQNPPEEVKRLVEFARKSDYDVVYTYFDKKYHSFWRNLGSKFNDKVANILLNKPKDLYLSSFRILRSFVVKEIVKYKLPFTFIDGLILRTTSNIGRFKVRHQPRKYGHSQYTLRKLIDLWLNMFTNFSLLPLRFVFFLGIFAFSFGLILTLLSAVDFINLDDEFIFLVILLMFTGLIFSVLGLIGEYVGRIFLSINQQPQFVIRKRFVKSKTNATEETNTQKDVRN